jgi:hypothetical protein
VYAVSPLFYFGPLGERAPQALMTVLSEIFKLFAIFLQGIPKRRNSVIFFDNFWYNGICCKGGIRILTLISAAVRIGYNRVSFYL